MKYLLKPLVVFILAFSARAVLRRYRPRIVMVTGSVGKTSTKDAIAAVLAKKYFVRASEKSFNSEFGVPFTILGVGNPWSNPLAWLKVLKNTLALLLLPNHYPNMLVLEVGSGKPGDLAQILEIATPSIVVVTRLPEIPVHVETYASPRAVQEEEFSPAYALPAHAPLIIPADDSYAVEHAPRTSARIISYGISNEATVRVSEICFSETEKSVAGMQSRVQVAGEQSDLVIKGSVGNTQILPLAAALAVAYALEMPLAEALTGVETYEAPPGRGRLLRGAHDSVIIDDSYNASPVAVEGALATLKSFPHTGRRIAVLGDMLELGRYSVVEHERIGILAVDSADVIVAVGIRARAFTTVPTNAEVLFFDNARAAALALVDYVRSGDVVLVKGSQSIRMERVVEALLADPTDASKLVRQEKEWKRKA